MIIFTNFITLQNLKIKEKNILNSRKKEKKQKYSYIFLKIVFLFLFFQIFTSTFADSYPELEKTIRDLKEKISKTHNQIKQVDEKIEEDEKEFLSYQKNNEKYFNQQKAELDSLKSDYNKFYQKSDSISNLINEVKREQGELDLQQDRFQRQLIKACEELKKAISLFPPGNLIKNQISSIEFLHSELTTKAVDNIEALERLWQILGTLSEGTQAVETFSNQSPVSFISGEVNFVRIGYAYLAIVNEKGTSGALWTPPTDTSEGLWVEIKDQKHLLALKKCIQIRQGATVPEIIDIPFKHPLFVDMRGSKGGNQ